MRCVVACVGLGLIACIGPEGQELAPVELVELAIDSRLNDVDSKYAVGAGGVLLVDGVAVSGLPDAELHSVRDCLVSGCDDYAVGAAGTVLIRAGESELWEQLDLGLAGDLHDITRIDGSIVIVGEDTLRVWDEFEGPGVGFDPAPPDPAGWGELHDIFGYTIVGADGRIYESPDLHEWSRVDSGTTEDLWALGTLDEDPSDFEPGELWAVGAGGTVLARRADGWRRVEVEVDEDLLGFAAGYAITSGRELVRFSLGGDHQVISRFDRDPRALQVVAHEQTIVTVVGDGGLMARIQP